MKSIGASEAKPHAGDLGLIRNALAESADVYGLRKTARELGMSPTGLRNLIGGSRPSGKTLRRVHAWYARWNYRHGSLDVADQMAIEVLVATLPKTRQRSAVALLKEVLRVVRLSA